MSSPVIRMMAAMIVATAVATQPAVGVCRRAAQMSPPVVDEAGAGSWGTLASDVSFSRVGFLGAWVLRCAVLGRRVRGGRGRGGRVLGGGGRENLAVGVGCLDVLWVVVGRVRGIHRC